jgi:hypothetical protein
LLDMDSVLSKQEIAAINSLEAKKKAQSPAGTKNA